jgi:hypothetical protein
LTVAEILPDRPEPPPPPGSEPLPEPYHKPPTPWHHGHRWVLLVAAAFVLGLGVYVGWVIIKFWLRWLGGYGE